MFLEEKFDTLQLNWPDEGKHCHCSRLVVSGRDLTLLQLIVALVALLFQSLKLVLNYLQYCHQKIFIFCYHCHRQKAKKLKLHEEPGFLSCLFESIPCLGKSGRSQAIYLYPSRKRAWIFLSSDFYVGEIKFIILVL